MIIYVMSVNLIYDSKCLGDIERHREAARISKGVAQNSVPHDHGLEPTNKRSPRKIALIAIGYDRNTAKEMFLLVQN